MINSKDFIKMLNLNDLNFFCGVPDSLMTSFSKSLHFDFKDKNHIIATNEGSALGICAGYHLATNNIPLIYMQNSGLGNFINPYVSLLHSKIYRIPFVLLLGWRGQPDVSDEPQHVFQGKITLKLLELLEINYLVISNKTSLQEISTFLSTNLKKKLPIAIVVTKNTFEIDQRTFYNNSSLVKRKEFLENIINKFDENTVFISTTGKLSRELYQIRNENSQLKNDFYTVGGMGHASAISFGISQYTKQEGKKIVCLDGDGSILMHLGNSGLIGVAKNNNFFHIVFNNSSHESVGGQPNIYSKLDTIELFKSLGYTNLFLIKKLADLDEIKFENLTGPVYIEVIVQNFSEDNLPRPHTTPLENKIEFMKKFGNEARNL
jgi:phosphonopyruvate decarboxylase